MLGAWQVSLMRSKDHRSNDDDNDDDDNNNNDNINGEWFFNCYLAAPRPNLGHYRGTHPMLITAFYIFDLRFTASLVTRLGP